MNPIDHPHGSLLQATDMKCDAVSRGMKRFDDFTGFTQLARKRNIESIAKS